MEINLGELIETKLQLKDGGGFELARVTWIFSSGAEIRGGRITRSKHDDQPWIQLPKYKSRNGIWVPIIQLRSEDQRQLEIQTKKQYEFVLQSKAMVPTHVV